MNNRLLIGIDETGEFSGNTLTGNKKKSGIAAAATFKNKKEVETFLKKEALNFSLSYPEDFHAMERISGFGSTGRNFSFKKALKHINDIHIAMGRIIEFESGVYGSMPGRSFFHEQQAYGEMLIALLSIIPEDYGEILKNAESIEIVIATRAKFLLGKTLSKDEYHRQLCEFIEQNLKDLGWPQKTRVSYAVATEDPVLMLADFTAFRLSQKPRPSWCRIASEIDLSAIGRQASEKIASIEPSGAILFDLINGGGDAAAQFKKLDKQSRYEVLRKLTTTAHAEVSTRGDSGDMERAWTLVDFVWSMAEQFNNAVIKGELVTIAAELCSHTGFDFRDALVKKWKERADNLENVSWAQNSFQVYPARLNYRCQSVQIEDFNVFDFDNAYLEFMDIKENYEQKLLPDSPIENDELYGKILGTIGQASAFLRSQHLTDENEAFEFFNKSKGYFSAGSHIFKAMNLGFRITDLWDRGRLEAAKALLKEDDLLDVAKRSDAYALLHRLRLAALEFEMTGKKVTDWHLLTNRLKTLLADKKFMGATPFDISLKWALFVEPKNSEITEAAKEWLKAFQPEQTAITATSLPLLLLTGQQGAAEERIEKLLTLNGFKAHYNTEQAEPFKKHVESASIHYPAYKELKAMPWNYS